MSALICRSIWRYDNSPARDQRDDKGQIQMLDPRYNTHRGTCCAVKQGLLTAGHVARTPGDWISLGGSTDGRVVEVLYEYAMRKDAKGRNLPPDVWQDLALCSYPGDHGLKELQPAAREPAEGESLYWGGTDIETWREEGGRSRVLYYDDYWMHFELPDKGRLDHGDSGGPVLNASGELVGIVHGYVFRNSDGKTLRGKAQRLAYVLTFLDNFEDPT